MSGSNLTVSGGTGEHGGLVGMPSTFNSTINQFLQGYLGQLSSSISGGQLGVYNDDVASGTPYVTGPGGDEIEEITNTDSGGSTTAGSGSYSVAASNSASTLIVQAPGNVTVDASSATGAALFGASSNVDYVDNTGSAASIYAAGGNDTISLQFSNNSSNDFIVAAGGVDSIQLLNQGNDYVTLGGNPGGSPGYDDVQVQEAHATIMATGNASVGVYWYSANSGGSLDFINNSTIAATVYGSVFDGVQAATHVTANGGSAGGYYSAGMGGNSSLYGAAGIVTLVGAANGDTLAANGYSTVGTGNALFGGSGTELLTASSTTGNNLFEVGYNYPGLATPPDGNGTISSAGSGAQNYFLGKVTGETIIGSLAATANNYNIISNSAVGADGGSNFVIENFTKNSFLLFDNASINGPGSATISKIEADPIYGSNSTMIVLSDSTQIHLIGVSESSITTGIVGNGIHYITV